MSHPLDDLDSPIEDVPPLELEPTTHYLPDSPEGHMHTLSPDKSPSELWQQWLDHLESPVSHKHFLSPSSPSSAPMRQRTSWEGSYQSITPQILLPIASISPLSQGDWSISSKESLDSSLSTQAPIPVNDNELSLNWITLTHDYQKG